MVPAKMIFRILLTFPFMDFPQGVASNKYGDLFSTAGGCEIEPSRPLFMQIACVSFVSNLVTSVECFPTHSRCPFTGCSTETFRKKKSMTHNDRSSRSRRRERRSSEDDTQSISLSEVNDYYPASRAYSIQGLDTISQIVYPPQEQSYPQSGDDYYLVTDSPAYYPTTAPGYSGQLGVGDGYVSSIATSSMDSAPFSNGWDTQSSAVASSRATTAPPRYNTNNVDFHVNAQPTATQRYQLPCEIRGCGVVYHGDEEDEWIRHTEGHFGGTFPSRLRCCKLTIPEVKLSWALTMDMGWG